MVKDTWGERVTLQCPYRIGNYLSAYEVEWTTLIGDNIIVTGTIQFESDGFLLVSRT